MGESSMTGNLQSQATETSLLVAAVQITPTAETLVTARTSLDNAITTVDASTQNTTLVKLSIDRTTNTIDTTENTESSVAEDLTPSSTGVGAVTTVTLQETSTNVIMLRTQVLNEATTTTSLLVPAIQITPTVETFVTARTSLDHSINTVDVITQNTTPVESIVARTSNVMAMPENTESTIVETPTPRNTDVGAVTTATFQETSTVTVPKLQTQTTNEQTTTNVPTKDAHVTTINGRYSTMTTKNKLPLRCWQRICPNKQATGTADFKRILKNETSKYRRRHISVNDERLSCAVMGFFGLSLLLALLLFFVVDDFKRMKDACLYNIHLKRPQKSTTKSSKVDSKTKIAGNSSWLRNSERH